MVERHQLQSPRTEDACAIELATVRQHFAEAHVIRRGRYETAGAGQIGAWLRVRAAVGRLGEHVAAVAFGSRLVVGGEPVDLGLGDLESGVRHAQWTGDALLKEMVKSLAAQELAEVTDDICRDAVVPLRARVARQGQPPQLRDEVGQRPIR